VIAAVAVRYSDKIQLGPWWLAVGEGIVLAALAWRRYGYRVRVAWSRRSAPGWAVPCAVFSGSLVVDLVAALAVRTKQSIDWEAMLGAAQSIADGDWSFSESAYYYYHAYQTPWTLLEAGLLRVGGGSVVPILIVNALAMAGTNLLVYLMARRLTGSAAVGIAVAAAYLLCPGHILLANVLTNEHMSTVLLYLGLYLAVLAAAGPFKWRGAGLFAAAGLALELGNLARPAGIAMWMGMIGLLVWSLMSARKGAAGRRVGRIAAGMGVAAAVYLIVGAGASWTIQATGVNDQGLKNNLPELKVLRAFAPANPEVLDQAREDVGFGFPGVLEDPPHPEAREIVRRYVEKEIADLPNDWQPTLRLQLWRLWGQNTMGAWYFNIDDPTPATSFARAGLVLLERGLFLPIVIMAGWATIMNRRSWSVLATALACFVAAYALMHLAIEVQPRYRYLAMPALFALGAPAWARLMGGTRRSRDRQP
jgi:hypothetical protein